MCCKIYSNVIYFFVIICDLKKLTEKGCLGPPDIIIEITSSHTGTKDKIEKFTIHSMSIDFPYNYNLSFKANGCAAIWLIYRNYQFH